jgi:SynChlorMet cassette protein ScmC
MNYLQTQRASLDLVLADGSRWEIAAEDEQAASIVSQLGGAMQLGMTPGAVEPSFHGHPCRLVVRVDVHAPVARGTIPLASENGGAVVCILSPCDRWGIRYVNLVRLSLVFAREAQARGGVLMHGALAERDGIGVILAAPGGMGKTTASNRLPAPWRSLCDDTTLVVRDPEGIYRAHPWPTWSRFRDGGPGGTWDVQKAVPVKGIFFLAQAEADRVEWVGPGQAAGLLGEFVEQVSTLMAWDGRKEEIRALHLERFNNVCALVRAVPAYMLHISLTGAFWQEIERALEGGFCDETRDTIGPDGSGPKPQRA